MSSTYVYRPEATYQTPYWHTPAPATPFSPFIPDVTLYPPSPYSRPGSMPGSPNLGGVPLPPAPIPFPSLIPNANEPVWTANRSRRPSWHGGPIADNNGLLFANPMGGHTRSVSFGHSTAPPMSPMYPQPPLPAPVPIYNAWNPNSHSPWYNHYLALQPQVQQRYIHPWLNGESMRSDFLFNLASANFAPMRVIGPRGETALLGAEELAQPATYPPIHWLTIVCDRIPQWPVELRFQQNYQAPGSPYFPHAPPSPSGIPPVTVGDVLVMIHRKLHEQITQLDWSALSSSQEIEVAKAFTRRCKAADPQVQTLVRSQGVKKVDYLLDKVWFNGLLRTGESLEQVKLVTR